MTNSSPSSRIHSLDALRAILMILGIVLHASESYMVSANDIWPRDPQTTHVFLNYLNAIIHLFRMPIFFIIAGFFGALLFYERGAGSMLKNRFARIAMPFMVLLMLLHPIIIGAVRFTSEAFSVSLTELSTAFTLLPEVSYHLWFLYYLIIFTVIAYVLALMVKSMKWGSWIKQLFEWFMHRRFVLIACLSVAVFLLLVWMWNYWVTTPLSFIPDIQVIIFYGLFYFFGWVLYHSKNLLEDFKRFDWAFLIIGMVGFTVKFFVGAEHLGDIAYGGLNALLVWFFVFGIIGLFHRYFSVPSFRMRYISDASYWVYLIHLPLTLFIPGLLVNLGLSAFGKFLVVVAATTVITFTTYHYMVRSTFIGQFLNGRKYPSKQLD